MTLISGQINFGSLIFISRYLWFQYMLRTIIILNDTEISTSQAINTKTIIIQTWMATLASFWLYRILPN